MEITKNMIKKSNYILLYLLLIKKENILKYLIRLNNIFMVKLKIFYKQQKDKNI